MIIGMRTGASVPVADSLALCWATTDVDLVHGGRTTPLVAGDLVLVDRLLPVDIVGSSESAAHLIDLGNRRLAGLIGDDRRVFARPLRRTSPLFPIVTRLCALAAETGTNQAAEALADSGLADMMTNLVAKLVTDSFDWASSRHSAAMLERARQLIRLHCGEHDFKVSALARHMGISSRHLSTLFAQGGTTTARDILEERLRRAARLLADRSNGRRQIADIARACGFEDQTRFGRCFRRQYGVSPRDFRSLNRAG